MTTVIEGSRGIYLGAQARLLDLEHETASDWAAKHVKPNKAHAFILGRFVEADRANNNRQLFSLKGLQMGRPTIEHAPLNMNHEYRHVVGAFAAAELLYPTVDAAEAAMVPDRELNPFIEALAVFWKHYFRKEYAEVEAAHAEGRLYFSMECIPAKVQCVGDGGCQAEFAYAGRVSETYCTHLNETSSDKLLIEPHFTAGAALVPPVRPGWSNADVHTLVAAHADLAEDIYNDVARDLPHLDPVQWEALMHELLALAA